MGARGQLVRLAPGQVPTRDGFGAPGDGVSGYEPTVHHHYAGDTKGASSRVMA